MESCGVIDLHCDTLSKIKDTNIDVKDYNFVDTNFHVDLNKLKSGNYFLQCFAVFVDTKASTNPMSEAMEQINIFQGLMDKYKVYLRQALSYEDVVNNINNEKLSAILTIEDGALLSGNIDLLGDFYKLGVRIITLTWNYENQLGYPNVVVKKEDKIFEQRANKFLGLKKNGIEFINKMEELGIIVDVSHLSDGGFWDVYNNSHKPFIASHSNARELCNHVRNLTDEMIKAIGNRGGIIGINYNSEFLCDNGMEGNRISTVKAIVNHIDYIKNIGGIGVIALGSDFDGICCQLEMKDASCLGMLYEELKKRKYTENEIEAIFYNNALRVFVDCL